MAFICFLCAGIYLIIQVFVAFDGIIVRVFTITVVLVQLISYMVVAVSNPGIALDENMASEGDDESEMKR